MEKPGRTVKSELKHFLADTGRTQTWVARKMKVGEATLSRVLAGKRKPTPEFIEHFRAVTGIDLDQFPRNRAGCLLPKAGPVAAPEAEVV